MTLELVLSGAGRFAVIAGVFMLTAVMFSAAVQGVGQSVARLVSRHGARGTLTILVRARCYSTAASRRAATWRVYAQAAREAFGASLAAVPVVLLLAVPMVLSFRRAETVIQGAAYALLLGSLVYFVGPTGLKRALVRLGTEPTDRGWPPAIAHVNGSTTPGAHWKASVRSYHRYLHGSLVRVAMLGTVLSLFGIPSLTVSGVGENPAATGYFALIMLLLVVGEHLLSNFPWWFDRRLRTIGFITAFLAGAPPKRRWLRDILDVEPFGKVREPEEDKSSKPTRTRLVRVVAAIERYARALHRSQRLNLRHPLAHVLDLETAQLRAYLAEPRSLEEVVPDEIREALRRISSILVGGTSMFLQETAVELNHLEEQVLTEPERTSWISRFSGAVDLTGKTLTLVQVLVVVGLTMAIPAYLLLSGQATHDEIIDAVTGNVGFSTSP